MPPDITYYLLSLVYVAQWKFAEALVAINRSLALNTNLLEAKKAKDKIMAWIKAAEEKAAQTAPAAR